MSSDDSQSYTSNAQYDPEQFYLNSDSDAENPSFGDASVHETSGSKESEAQSPSNQTLHELFRTKPSEAPSSSSRPSKAIVDQESKTGPPSNPPLSPCSDLMMASSELPDYVPVPHTAVSEDIRELANRMFVPIPVAAGLRKISKEDVRNVVCIPRMHLQYGLTLPFPSLLLKLLDLHHLSVAQLHPNCIVVIMGFLVHCRRLNVQPSFDLFRSFYYLCASSPSKTPGVYTLSPRSGTKHLIQGKRLSVKGWADREYYAYDSSQFPSYTWNPTFKGETKTRLLPDAVAEAHARLASVNFFASSFHYSYIDCYWWPREIYDPRTFQQKRIFVLWPSEGLYL